MLAAIVGLTVIGLDVVCDSAPRPDPAAVSADGFPGRDPFPGASIRGDDRFDVSTATATRGRPARSGDAGLGIALLVTGLALAAVAGLAHARRRRHQVTGSAARP
ncbi:hypothetical protein LZG04_04720 [Saccharothrix sp. S26]|uniref:hypothetical protein n=1 Tax=Saccharothrix sp. S26 TaxID=2907215 RepID=UPI001F364F5D|nr:hypothetical protein [Saccharothrix sp. S26]MCE6994117.1 hypothetical protein [Saccharothrix sp. S26]